jgi:predicted Zn-dependent protease
MPKEVEDKAVVDYVKTLAQNLAAHSDLQVPLNLTVLDSKEINAFALPGGYLFLERGLLEAADNESELAGVIAHEMSHVVARHGKRLMKKGTIASIIYHAAQVAALVLTGGVAGIGTYYALQYGFYGLGLVLNLELLGVSRDYEREADQLGIQYAWNSGYSPDGFTEFFDKIATKEGYINGVSWFRTHPPFYQRMAEAEREIMFLPKHKNLVVQSSGFEDMKRALAGVTRKASEEERGRPSLLAAEQGCPAPKRIKYKPGQPIETLCEVSERQASGEKK